MQAQIGDRLILHGKGGTRIGVVVELTDGGSLVRWADGGENVLSVGTDAPEAHATWEAAKAAAVDRRPWRRGVTAGVGREAALRQEKLAREAPATLEAPGVAGPAEGAVAVVAEEAPAEAGEGAEHKAAAGE